MTHEQAHALFLDLAYGELAPEELGEVSRHAAECSACAAELERISSARALVSDLGGGPRPSRAREELVEAARRAVAGRPTRRWFARPAALSFGAAAAVVAIVAGVTLQLARDGGRRGDEEFAVSSPEPSPATPHGFAAAPPPPSPASPEVARPEAAAPGAAAPARRPTPPQRTTAAAPRTAPAPSAPARARREGEPPAAVAAAPAAPPRTMAAPPAAASREVAPESAGEPMPARKAERRVAGATGESATADAGDASQIIREVERRAAVGELTEERRELRCGGALIQRVALVARGGRVVKLSERRGGELLEAWYDDGGHLRATRTAGANAGHAGASWPRSAPALEAVATSCTW